MRGAFPHLPFLMGAPQLSKPMLLGATAPGTEPNLDEPLGTVLERGCTVRAALHNSSEFSMPETDSRARLWVQTSVSHQHAHHKLRIDQRWSQGMAN